MSDDLQPFFDAILAAPDDDAPRLALARHLTERGDERGENIRISCELEALAPRDPARAALQVRADQPPCFWWFTPLSTSFPLMINRQRGFVAKIECAIWDFVKHADEILSHAPIHTYEANPIGEWGPTLARCAALARIPSLVLGWCTPEARTAILASPHLAKLHMLAMAVQLHERHHVTQLANDLKGLAGLRVLRLSSGTIAKDVHVTLGNLARDLDLEQLDLRGVVTPDLAPIRALLGDRLLPRPVPRMTFEFGVLDLRAGKLTALEIRALVDSGEFRSATTLALGGNRIGDAGIEHLARAGAFPALVDLQLGGTGLTDTSARVFAREGVGFEHLETLDLGDVPAAGPDVGARDGSGVSDEVVAELARSPRLPALRSIARGKEYRHLAPNASEGREVVPIARDDGRVVESIIFHSIWP